MIIVLGEFSPPAVQGPPSSPPQLGTPLAALFGAPIVGQPMVADLGAAFGSPVGLPLRFEVSPGALGPDGDSWHLTPDAAGPRTVQAAAIDPYGRRIEVSAGLTVAPAAPAPRVVDAVDGASALAWFDPAALDPAVTATEMSLDGTAPTTLSLASDGFATVSSFTAGQPLRFRHVAGTAAGPWSAPSTVAIAPAQSGRFFAWNDAATVAADIAGVGAVAATLPTLARPPLAGPPAPVPVVFPVGDAHGVDLNALVADPVPAGITRAWSVVSGADTLTAVGATLAPATGVLGGTAPVALPPSVISPLPTERNWTAGTEPLRGAPVVVRCTASSTGSPDRFVDLTLEIEARNVEKPENQGPRVYRKTTWLIASATPVVGDVYAFSTIPTTDLVAPEPRAVRVYAGSSVTGAFTDITANATVDLDAGTFTLASPPAAYALLRVEVDITRTWAQALAAGDVAQHIVAASRKVADARVGNPLKPAKAIAQPALWFTPGATYPCKSAIYVDSLGANYSDLTVAMNGATILFDADNDWQASPNLLHTSDKITYCMSLSSKLTRVRWIGAGTIRVVKGRTPPDETAAAAFEALGLLRLASAVAAESPPATTDAARFATLSPVMDELTALYRLMFGLPGNMVEFKTVEFQLDSTTFEAVIDEAGDDPDGADNTYTQYGTFAPIAAPTPQGRSRWSNVQSTLRAQYPWLAATRTMSIRLDRQVAAVIDESANTAALAPFVYVTSLDASTPTPLAVAPAKDYATGPYTLTLPAGLSWVAGDATLTAGGATLTVAVDAAGVLSEKSAGAWAAAFGAVSDADWNAAVLTAPLASDGALEAKYQPKKPGASPLKIEAGATLYARDITAAIRRGTLPGGGVNPSSHLEGGFWFVASGGTSDWLVERCHVIQECRDEAVAFKDIRIYTGDPTAASATRFRRWRIRDLIIDCADDSRCYGISAYMDDSNKNNPWLFDPNNDDLTLATDFRSGIDRLTINLGAAQSSPFAISQRGFAVPIGDLTLNISAPDAAKPFGLSTVGDNSSTFRAIHSEFKPTDPAMTIPAVNNLTIRATGFAAPQAGRVYGPSQRIFDGAFRVRGRIDVRSDMVRLDPVTGAATTVPVWEKLSATGANGGLLLDDAATGLIRSRRADSGTDGHGFTGRALALYDDADGIAPRALPYPDLWGVGTDVAASAGGLLRFDHDAETGLSVRRFDPNGAFGGLTTLAQVETNGWVMIESEDDIAPLAASVGPSGTGRWTGNGDGSWTAGPGSVRYLQWIFNAAAGPRLIAGQRYRLTADVTRTAGALQMRIGATALVQTGGQNASGALVFEAVAGNGPTIIELNPGTLWQGTVSNVKIRGPIGRRVAAVVTGRP